jgi:hypothetical protein
MKLLAIAALAACASAFDVLTQGHADASYPFEDKRSDEEITRTFNAAGLVAADRHQDMH